MMERQEPYDVPALTTKQWERQIIQMAEAVRAARNAEREECAVLLDAAIAAMWAAIDSGPTEEMRAKFEYTIRALQPLSAAIRTRGNL